MWGCNNNQDPIRRKLVDHTEAQVSKSSLKTRMQTIWFQAKKEKAASYHLELAELANQKYEEKKQQRDQNLIEDQKVRM